jgi:hypothetical protein
MLQKMARSKKSRPSKESRVSKKAKRWRVMGKKLSQRIPLTLILV